MCCDGKIQFSTFHYKHQYRFAFIPFIPWMLIITVDPGSESSLMVCRDCGSVTIMLMIIVKMFSGQSTSSMLYTGVIKESI